MENHQFHVWLQVASRQLAYSEKKNEATDEIAALSEQRREHSTRLETLREHYRQKGQTQQTRKEQNRFNAEKARLTKAKICCEQKLKILEQELEILWLKFELAEALAKLARFDPTYFVQ